MGYLGSSLNDYYSYQLIEKVIEQVRNNDMGDLNELKIELKKLNELVSEKERDEYYENVAKTESDATMTNEC